ncbi:MAG: DUF4433 domain-containing protein [Euryarchaeota archaeon]|nr:DUF4433 domain-containing protein [Euryarchaeota archaeon]
MNLDDIDGLYYITHTDNLESICQKGILSHACARRLPHTSIAKSEVIELRKKKSVPKGRPLLEYVNLYFNPRNPMMYKVTDGGKNLGNVCLLKVDRHVLHKPGVVISDGNAASDYTRFYASPQGLQHLKPGEIFVTYWTDDDPVMQYRLKSTTCSEVLVPDLVARTQINQLILPTDMHVAAVRAGIGPLEVRIDKQPFFG